MIEKLDYGIVYSPKVLYKKINEMINAINKLEREGEKND